MLTDVQTPFLGTPLVPLKSQPRATPHHSTVIALASFRSLLFDGLLNGSRPSPRGTFGIGEGLN